MKKRFFVIAAAATCLLFSERCSRKDSAHDAQTENSTVLPNHWDGDGYIGPGTKKSYPPEQIAALREHAAIPIALFSTDDKASLTNPYDREGSLQQIASWLPKSMIYAEPLLQDIYFNIVYKQKAAETIPVYSSEDPQDPKRQYIGAIITIPGSSNALDTLQLETGIKFNQSLINNSLLNEIRLGWAAHEASHANNEKENDPDETTAEIGENHFISEHPEYFPTLKSKDKFQAYVFNSRAFAPLAAQWSASDNYTAIAFCSMEKNSCPVTTGQEAARLGNDIMGKTSAFMHQHNLVKEPGFSDYLLYSIRHFDSDKAHARQFYLTKNLYDVFDQPLCLSHDNPCQNVGFIADAKNPLLNSFVATIENLNKQGAFAGSPASVYATNIVAAGELYLDKDSFTKARTTVLNVAPMPANSAPLKASLDSLTVR